MDAVITWDEPKRLANLAKHGLDFADVSPDFFETALFRAISRGRFMAVGRLGELAVSVVFAPLGTQALALISVRTASAKERRML